MERKVQKHIQKHRKQTQKQSCVCLNFKVGLQTRGSFCERNSFIYRVPQWGRGEGWCGREVVVGVGGGVVGVGRW